jgi:thiamine biosynthesis lipoprotein
MGTTISLLLPQPQAQAETDVVRTLFAGWERTLSRFLPESELSQLNQRAGTAVAVSPLLYTVLTIALTAAQETEGVYDPTLLGQLVGLGYDRTFDELPATRQEPVRPVEPGGGWRRIRVDPVSRRVTLPVGVGLDFGGIAKGMAVDAAIVRLHHSGVQSALVNAGGDLAVLGLPPAMEAWPIAVPGKGASWTVPLQRGAMATSGIARRHWQQGARQRHHLLDPRTGEPAQTGLWSVTVVADRCEQAEVAAKVAFILGVEQGADFLHNHRIAGLLVREDGTWVAVDPWPTHLMRHMEVYP